MFSIVSVTMLLICAICVMSETLKAKTNGFIKTLVSLGTVVASAVVSVIISPTLSYFIVQKNEKLLNQIDFYRSMNNSADTKVLLDALMGMILSSVVFVLLFFVIKSIIATCVNFVVFDKKRVLPEYIGKKDGWIDRNRSALTIFMGVASGIIITMLVTSPIMGTLDVVDHTFKVISKVDKGMEEEVGEVEELALLKKYSNDIPGNIFYQFGGKLAYSMSTSSLAYGQKVYLVNEMKVLETILADITVIMPKLETPNELTKEDIALINEICRQVSKMKISHIYLNDILVVWSNSWLNDKAYMGVKMPDMGDSINSLFYEILNVCQKSNVSSARENTVTLLRIFAIVAESGMLSVSEADYSALFEIATRNEIVDKIDEELAKNPSMYYVRKKVSGVVLGILASNVHPEKFGNDKYVTLLQGLAESVIDVNLSDISFESKLAVLSGYTGEYMREYGIQLTKYVADIAAESLLAEMKLLGEEVSETDIEKFFKSFR